MNKRLVIGGFILIDVVILIVLVVMYVMKVSKTAVLDVMLAPRTAKVMINGEEYMQGVYKMYPGTVQATIVADGFESKTIELNLTADEYTKVYDYLLPTADNATYYAKNEDDAKTLALIGGEEAQEILNSISILNVLPIIDFQYGGLYGESKEIVIDRYFDCDEYICLQVVGARLVSSGLQAER